MNKKFAIILIIFLLYSAIQNFFIPLRFINIFAQHFNIYPESDLIELTLTDLLTSPFPDMIRAPNVFLCTLSHHYTEGNQKACKVHQEVTFLEYV